MSELFKAMAVENNNTETENGCPAYKSTLDSLLDLFASGASCRSDSKRLKSLVRKAYSEDKLFCIRILFYFRDIRGNGGQGERNVFREGMKELIDIDPKTICKVLRFIPFYGRWDDLIALYGIERSISNHIAEIIKFQINEDIQKLDKDKPDISLCAKWLPSCNTSSKHTRAIANKIRREVFGIDEKSYRKMLSRLRKAPPLPNDLAVAFPNLPLNLTKTDEENWENIPEHQLLLGQKALVTRKMDGCSATYILTAGGEFYCCGRRFTYKNDCFNRYTKVGHEIVRPALEKWVKKYNETIIVRGEITGHGVNGNKVNKDSKGPLKFNLFKTIHPSKDNTIWKWGLYGTQGHFLWCTEVLGLELETVPILGEMTITKDLLLQFQQAPKEDGEGVVIEFEDGTHYKAKSMDYYSNI